MYKLTQCRYCTKNEKGLFEVSYTIDSFWRELLGLKTKFVFTLIKNQVILNLLNNLRINTVVHIYKEL